MKLQLLEEYEIDSVTSFVDGGSGQRGWYNTISVPYQVTPYPSLAPTVNPVAEQVSCDEVLQVITSVNLPKPGPARMHWVENIAVMPPLGDPWDGAGRNYQNISGRMRSPAPVPVPGIQIVGDALGGELDPTETNVALKMNNRIYLTLTLKHNGSLDVTVAGEVLERLRVVFGDAIEMNLTFKDMTLSFKENDVLMGPLQRLGILFPRHGLSAPLFWLVPSLSVVGIRYRHGLQQSFGYSCFGAEVVSMFPLDQTSRIIRNGYAARFRFGGRISLEVNLPDILNSFVHKGLPLGINKKILRDEVATDVTLFVGAEQIPIKCHKSFLNAQSSVFTAMFSGRFLENEEVFMKTETERGVRALLAFLYTFEVEGPSADLGLALELLKMAHFYDIKRLEAAMFSIFINRRESNFSVEVAVDLFLHSRGIQQYQDLKLKAVRVIKYNRERLTTIRKYVEIFEHEDSAPAMELCQLLMEHL